MLHIYIYIYDISNLRVNPASSLEGAGAVVSVWNRGCFSSVVNDRGKYCSFHNVSFSEHYTVNRVKKNSGFL